VSKFKIFDLFFKSAVVDYERPDESKNFYASVFRGTVIKQTHTHTYRANVHRLAGDKIYFKKTEDKN